MKFIMIQNNNIFRIIGIIFKYLLFFFKLIMNIFKKSFLSRFIIFFFICFYLLNIYYILTPSYLFYTSFELPEDYIIQYKEWDITFIISSLGLLTCLLIITAFILVVLKCLFLIEDCIIFLRTFPKILVINDFYKYCIILLFVFIIDFILLIIMIFKNLIEIYIIIKFLKKLYLNRWNKIKKILFIIILLLILIILIIFLIKFIIYNFYTSIIIILALLSIRFLFFKKGYSKF